MAGGEEVRPREPGQAPPEIVRFLDRTGIGHEIMARDRIVLGGGNRHFRIIIHPTVPRAVPLMEAVEGLAVEIEP